MPRSHTTLFVIALAALILVPAVPTAEEIAPADRARLVQHLTTTRDQVVAAFRDRRGVTLAYAAKTPEDLRSRVMDSPIGPVDGYQWLLFVSAHTERHLAQLREVKAHAQFPKM